MHQTAIIRIRHVRQTLIQVSVGVWVWGVRCVVWGLDGYCPQGSVVLVGRELRGWAVESESVCWQFTS